MNSNMLNVADLKLTTSFTAPYFHFKSYQVTGCVYLSVNVIETEIWLCTLEGLFSLNPTGNARTHLEAGYKWRESTHQIIMAWNVHAWACAGARRLIGTSICQKSFSHSLEIFYTASGAAALWERTCVHQTVQNSLPDIRPGYWLNDSVYVAGLSWEFMVRKWPCQYHFLLISGIYQI